MMMITLYYTTNIICAAPRGFPPVVFCFTLLYLIWRDMSSEAEGPRRALIAPPGVSRRGLL